MINKPGIRLLRPQKQCQKFQVLSGREREAVDPDEIWIQVVYVVQGGIPISLVLQDPSGLIIPFCG